MHSLILCGKPSDRLLLLERGQFKSKLRQVQLQEQEQEQQLLLLR